MRSFTTSSPIAWMPETPTFRRTCCSNVCRKSSRSRHANSPRSEPTSRVMAKIRDIEVIPLVFTPPVPYGSARGLARTRGGSLILLHTEDGIEGIGEAWGPPAVTYACLEAIKPFYIGQSVFAQQGAAQRVLAAMYHAGT